MAIIKRPSQPPAPSATAEAFIQGAPDATAEEPPVSRGVIQGKQRQVTFAMPPELLDKLEKNARKLSLTRSAFIKLALTRAIEAEENR
jgi:Ribbon-helix-helix protein, copG family